MLAPCSHAQFHGVRSETVLVLYGHSRMFKKIRNSACSEAGHSSYQNVWIIRASAVSQSWTK